MTEAAKEGMTTLSVTPEYDGVRLDRWLRRHCPSTPLSALHRRLRRKAIRIDGRPAEGATRLTAGQIVCLPSSLSPEAMAVSAPKAIATRQEAQLAARVLYCDEEVLAVDKPGGLATQGGGLRSLDAMLDALRFGCPERPRLVHRLDRATGGVLILARRRRSAAALAAAFRRRQVRKVYWALVLGCPEAMSGRIDIALSWSRKRRRTIGDETQGAEAVTDYRRIERSASHAWLEVVPLTGRMHQIRAHLSAMGHPIVGDRLYGESLCSAISEGEGEERRRTQGASATKAMTPPKTMGLHARSITFALPGASPGDAERRIHVEAPLSPEARRLWRRCGLHPPDDGGENVDENSPATPDAP